MLSMCFVCFLEEIQLFCNLSLPLFMICFSHLPFHNFTIQDLWGLLKKLPVSLFSGKKTSLRSGISYHTVQLHLGKFCPLSRRWMPLWFSVQMLLAFRFQRNLYVHYLYLCPYVYVSLFFMFKVISKRKTRLSLLCEASYRSRKQSWSLAKLLPTILGLFLGTTLRLLRCWDYYWFSLSYLPPGDLRVCRTQDLRGWWLHWGESYIDNSFQNH